jgi:transcriptional regulator with XRE-family HTH domain
MSENQRLMGSGTIVEGLDMAKKSRGAGSPPAKEERKDRGYRPKGRDYQKERQELLQSSVVKNIADHIILATEASGMRKSDFSTLVLGISYTQFREIKRRVGNPTLQTLEKIASALKITLPELFEPPPAVKRRQAPANRYEDHLDALGEVIFEHWERSGMTKLDFARQIKLSQPQFYKIQNGTAPVLLLTLVRVAEQLGISVAELLGEERPKRGA